MRAGCTEIRWAMCVIALDTTPGWLMADGRITLWAKSCPNILGWSWSSPSTSQMRPRPIWIVRADTRPDARGCMAVS